MRLQLTGYQTEAAADVVSSLQDAFDKFEQKQKLTAISLSAPTGAGKTVIATSVIEGLLTGTDIFEPDPDLTVLWVTDDPSLNEQTKRKMLTASDRIQPAQLVTVDPTLDQRELDLGRIYFVHIQQLGRGATNYVKVGNKRKYSLWTTIGNTIAHRGTHFLLIVDEAHKGTRRKAGGGKSITTQLIDGAGGTFPPTPVLLGISATPERFVEAITATGQRTLDPVVVKPEDVRESGLLKDKIRIRHPQEDRPADSTLLEMSVRDLKGFHDLWQEYSKDQDEPTVTPVLVIQVRPKISDGDLGSILDTLKAGWNVLDEKAIGHSFQDHTAISLGSRTIRYVAPQDIQDDPYLRVVIFKEALTTGWDCPRAEVMVSFRTAQDYTYIAQLIGRMVRTPLARRIATNDVLNTVSLYLPYYKEAQVTQVVAGLETDDSQLTSEIEIEGVNCGRNPKVGQDVWDLLAELPTYTRPGKYHRNEVARLNALAALLTGTHLDEDAIDTARKHLIDTLDREAVRLGPTLDQSVADLEQLQYEVIDVDLGTRKTTSATEFVDVNSRNIDDLFRRAKRLLGDATAKWYWDALLDEDDTMDADEAKLRVAALGFDSSVVTAVELSAEGLIDAWRGIHNSEISRLPDAKRDLFYAIWQQAKVPQQVTLILPQYVTSADKRVRKKGDEIVVEDVARYDWHIYANGRKRFPTPLGPWEREVLEAELQLPSLAGWYRNPVGGSAAIAVPYDQSGIARTLYPDLLFFHNVKGDIVVDMVDPHNPALADAGPKWRGLAAYSEKHGQQFRRIAAVIKDSEESLLSVDLKNANVARALEKAGNETDIRKLFARYGGIY